MQRARERWSRDLKALHPLISDRFVRIRGFTWQFTRSSASSQMIPDVASFALSVPNTLGRKSGARFMKVRAGAASIPGRRVSLLRSPMIEVKIQNKSRMKAQERHEIEMARREGGSSVKVQGSAYVMGLDRCVEWRAMIAGLRMCVCVCVCVATNGAAGVFNGREIRSYP